MARPKPNDIRCRPSELNDAILAYAGLRQMGMSWQEICTALHIGRNYGVRLVDIDRMVCVHNVLHYGVPGGVLGSLKSSVICPRCRSVIEFAPCMRCVAEGAWPSSLDDGYPDVEAF